MYENVSEKDAFQGVYKQYFSLIFRVVYVIVRDQEASEELCQEAFIRYYKHMDKIAKEIEKYWLIRVAKNLAINYAKRKEREYRAYDKVLRQPLSPAERTGEANLIREELSQEMLVAISQLPARLRETLVLKLYADLSYKEIGSVLGISDTAIKARMYRARIKLASILQSRGVSNDI